MKNRKVVYMTQAALIAAIYVVVTVILRPLGFGPVQVRISEMLCVLPIFTPAAVPGVALGCFIANILGGAILPDVICGTVATLIGAVLTYRLREKNRIIAVLPPIISNAAIVPFVLKYAYGEPFSIPFMMCTVGIGEVVSVGVLGLMLAAVLEGIRVRFSDRFNSAAGSSDKGCAPGKLRQKIKSASAARKIAAKAPEKGGG